MLETAAAGHHTQGVFHASMTSVGALLIGLGAAMLIVDAFGPASMQRHTWGGDVLSRPGMRLVESLAVVGAALVGVGSILLLIDAANLSFLVVVVVALGAALVVYARMTVHLYITSRALRRSGKGVDGHDQPRSLVWCMLHPLWTDPRHQERDDA
jgi:hypothetical protein